MGGNTVMGIDGYPEAIVDPPGWSYRSSADPSKNRAALVWLARGLKDIGFYARFVDLGGPRG